MSYLIHLGRFFCFALMLLSASARAQNPGFEDNLTGWSNNGIGTRTVITSSTNFRSGLKALQLSTTSTIDAKVFSPSFSVTVPATGTNYITVMAYVKGAAPAEVTVGMYDNTLSLETKSTTVYTPTSSFTLIQATFPATNGSVYYPYLYNRSTTGANASVIFDDVIIYTSTSSTTDITAPTAPNTFTTSISGTAITLGFSAGTDAQSGIDGVLIVRRNGGAIPTNQTALQQVWFSTNSLIGPTTPGGSFTVVYNGAALTSYTDNPGATGIYTYYVYMRDKAYNYTTSSTAARIFVFNGTSLSSSVANNCAVDAIHLPATCTLTLQSSSTITIRAGSIITIAGTVVMTGNLNNNQGAGALTFANGSLYRYARNGGGTFSVTTATWASGSVCRIDGITTAAPPGGLAQQFANFEWNCPMQVNLGSVILPNNFRCSQNCSIIDSGPSGGVTFSGYNIIGGNLSQNSGTNVSFAIGNTVEFNGTAAQTINVAGPMEGITLHHTGSGVSLLRNLQFNDTLNLLLGQMNPAAFTLTAGIGAAISRTSGTVTTAPVFSGNNDIIYRAALTTDVELPTSVSSIRNLSLLLPVNGNVIMNAAATVNGNLNLVRGWLITSAVNLLSIADDATASGASNVSFVNGPVLKTGNDAFIFPVGKNTYYAAIGISAPTSTSAGFRAEFFQTDPDPSFSVLLRDASLAGISRCEYWLLDRLSSADAISVTLSWDTTECGPGYVNSPSDLRVARWDGSLWRDHGNGGTTGSVQAGTVQTAGAVTSFSPFTLASFTSANPLPVDLLYFTASIDQKQVNVSWATTTEINSDYFIVERSVNGSDFEFLSRIDAAGNSLQTIRYQLIDENPFQGISYYRLRQIDFNGSQRTYQPVAVHFLSPQEISAEIRNNQLLIDFGQQAENFEAEIRLVNAAGQTCLYTKGSPAELTRINLNINAGVYFVQITSNTVNLRKAIVVTGY
jgi:hypothetical protein